MTESAFPQRPETCLQVVYLLRRCRGMAEELLRGTVVSQRKVTDVLRILEVEVPSELGFVAGQFTKIGLPEDGGGSLMRAYSFVNSPGQSPHEFYYDVLRSGGNLTPRLDSLSAGDELLVSERVNGLLHLENLPEGESLFLVASGTGIGPFLSILGTDAPWERFGKVVLVWSVRNREDMVYLDRIEAVAGDRGGQFAYLPIVTRESAEGMSSKRVTEALRDGELERAAGAEVGPGSQFLLCGNPAMVQDMSDLLKDRGLERNRRSRPGNVTIEKYWQAASDL